MLLSPSVVVLLSGGGQGLNLCSLNPSSVLLCHLLCDGSSPSGFVLHLEVALASAWVVPRWPGLLLLRSDLRDEMKPPPLIQVGGGHLTQWWGASNLRKGCRIPGVAPILRLGSLVDLSEHQILNCRAGNQCDFLMVRFTQERARKAFNTGYIVSSDNSNF